MTGCVFSVQLFHLLLHVRYLAHLSVTRGAMRSLLTGNCNFRRSSYDFCTVEAALSATFLLAAAQAVWTTSLI
jgi:hypothetical protein